MNVAGYVCWGVHSELDALYCYPGPPSETTPIPVCWTQASGWWLIDTVESFNGVPGAGQGNYYQWFSSFAFGTTNYLNTPVGAVTNTDEPGLGSELPEPYLRLWAAGRNFGICAWASRQTQYFQAVGDPFVTR
jgi:hypothetical protein